MEVWIDFKMIGAMKAGWSNLGMKEYALNIKEIVLCKMYAKN